MLNYRPTCLTSRRLRSLLEVLAAQPNHISTLPNAALAKAIGLNLDEGRIQNRRLNELVADLRDGGLIEVLYTAPHPKTNPTGRALKVTPNGLVQAGVVPASPASISQ